MEQESSSLNSLLFNGSYLLRLVFPLCVNFLSILRPDTETGFEKVFGGLQHVPIFGISFSICFPAVVILISTATYFNVYGKALKFLQLSDFDDNHSDEIEVKLGRALFARQNRIESRFNDGFETRMPLLK